MQTTALPNPALLCEVMPSQARAWTKTSQKILTSVDLSALSAEPAETESDDDHFFLFSSSFLLLLRTHKGTRYDEK